MCFQIVRIFMYNYSVETTISFPFLRRLRHLHRQFKNRTVINYLIINHFHPIKKPNYYDITMKFCVFGNNRLYPIQYALTSQTFSKRLYDARQYEYLCPIPPQLF